MAENTIDNLSIQVTASAESATRVFDRLASGMGRVRSASQGAAGGMEDAANAAEDMGTATATAGTESGKAAPKVRNLGKDAKTAGDNAKKGASGLKTFWESLKRIAFYRFVRSIIKSITNAFSTGITNLYHWSDALGGHFAKNMDRLATSTQYLKNGLGTLVAPLIEAVIPAIDWLIDRIVDGINYINMFFAAISGKSTYTAAKKVAAVWDDSSKKVASSTKKASDDIKRTILGFDEINKLVKQNESSGSSGRSSGKKLPNYGAMFEERPLTGGFKGFSNAIENALSNTLSRIGLIVSGASLAVGAILTFSGANVPLGLSLMAAGASGLVSIIGMNWNGLSADIKLAIGAVEAVVGGSLLAIGGILAFSGVKTGLGIAMMAAGAVSLASAVGLNWGFLTGKVSASAKGVVGAISAASIALGAILTFSGVNAPLGIGLMAAGISGAAVTLSWDWLKNKLRGQVATITAIVSGSLLALGAVLAFSGAATPLGIGMMAVGAVGLASTVAANWDVITNALRGTIGKATAIISGASLVLGILALICGAVPLGLGLILAGATGLAATVAANWNNLRNLGVLAIKMVKEGWDSLKNKAFQIAVNVINDAVKWWQDVQRWWNGVVGIVKGITTFVINNAKAWWRDVQHWWDGVVGTVAGFVTSVINNAATWWSNVKKWWGEKVGAVAGFTLNMINDAVKWWDDVKKFWEEATKDLSLGAAVDFLINVSVKIAGRIWDGVTSFWDWLWGKGGNVQPTGMIGSNGKMAEITASVDAVAGKNMIGGSSKFTGGLAPDVSDVDAVARIDADPEWGWAWNLLGYLGINNLDTSVWVDAETPWGYWHKSPLEWLGLNNLSTVVSVTAKVVGSVAGVVGKIFGRATGGVYSGGRWSDIPQYAGGTTNAGSLFVAGEAGPEIVGHVGGRTEVLNKSQLASAMYSAVQAAMAPAAANFAEAAANMGVAETGFDFETLADMVRQGVEQAMSRSNDYDRQKVELLRSINDKDFNVDVSTASINKAQQRMNRRAGVTIAPVGT